MTGRRSRASTSFDSEPERTFLRLRREARGKGIVGEELVEEDLRTTMDDEVQDNVREILTSVNPELVDFKTGKSSGDVFLIATAKKYGLSVISEEAAISPKKIPFTCQKMGIRRVSILGFMEDNGIAL